MHKIILASASPRRRELLSRIGLDIEVIPSQAEEDLTKNISPELLVSELALLKASDIGKITAKGFYIIGADTVVVYNKKVLGKPQNEQQAFEMLNMLQGKTHQVYTGICIIDTTSGKSVTAYECTSVSFLALSEQEINAYIKTGEPMDKAGAYGIQDLGALLIKGIEGDYFNVVGLPLSRLARLFKEEFGINLLI